MLKKIVCSPYLNFLAGFILLITSGIEVFESIESTKVGTHHGVFIYAIIHIVKSIPEILHGLDDIEKAEEH